MADGYDGNCEYDVGLWQKALEPVREPRTITCGCGRKLDLRSSWANECECGREYNGCGQLLVPRSQWGEETGERF